MSDDLWESVTVTSANGSEPDDETPDETNEELPEYDVLFAAPDFAFLKTARRTPKSRDYERRIQSLLKAGLLGSLHRGQLADAAALIKTGPKFARAVGDAADANDRVASVVDMITAPDSPMVPLALTSIALVSQLLRNHKAEAEEAAQTVRLNWRQRREARKAGLAAESRAVTTLHLPFGRKLSLRFRIHVPSLGRIWTGVTGGAMPPEALVHTVFSDDKLIKALHEQGILIRLKSDG